MCYTASTLGTKVALLAPPAVAMPREAGEGGIVYGELENGE